MDSDINFKRHFCDRLNKVLKKIQNINKVLHLCPGCIYNRIKVHQGFPLWGDYPPEQKITSSMDTTRTFYNDIPFKKCWYGGPIAALFRSYDAIEKTKNNILGNLNTPVDVTFSKSFNHHALVTPLCREKENGRKDI